MRRVRYHEYGGPEVLQVEEAEVPIPGEGQLLVKTEAIGANFVDTKYRQGPEAGAIFQRPLPGKPTGDVVGTVEAVGAGVEGFAVGERVAALVAEDAYADYVLATAQWVVKVAEGIDNGSATMLPMGAPVALRALRTGDFTPGESVLVHSAAGGIGHLAVQIAKLLGAGAVVATAGSDAKLEFAREHGADVTVNYTEENWTDQVRAAVPGGVDIVLDAVGGDILQRSFEVLAPYGRAVTYGAAGGDLISVPVTSLFALKSLAGFNLTAWRTARPERARAEMDELAGYFAAGRLTTAVHATVPLAEAAEAHRLLDDRAALGRVLLVP
ncbi:NADPH:quinone reductase-like Zn-dependent oxidoreductase [Actinocorallia herbida]|uniref:NADPH:quinone reductase-like Zn-dependent oxidoreductase n=1 Tax=Actinocorallia herbida TaxID=58109 RepID=A0A3N1D3U2_9ACTN|nr:zinc-binding dehydrogenase [Actinocorallia herbida]ROO88156.1 NADPH:quinone reductase-like Zn-dependent oxidoreductase [Actinocorallia herbida]